jgi:hypothetical protein
MGAKAFSFTHLHQGVCGQHGTEEQRVTSGELAEFPGGAGISRPISIKAKWRATLCQGSDGCILPIKRGENHVTEQSATEGVGEGQPAKMVRRRKKTR